MCYKDPQKGTTLEGSGEQFMPHGLELSASEAFPSEFSAASRLNKVGIEQPVGW